MYRNQDFEIIELEQGTQQWHEWRNNGIGATDAAVTIGKHGKGYDKLVRIKAGLEQRSEYQSPAMRQGLDLESEARQKYISHTGTGVEPVCVQHRRYPWLRASLDGISDDHQLVVEIKCGSNIYREVAESGSVPKIYYAQTQHILATTGLEKVDFWCYWPNKRELLVSISRDCDYIACLLEKEEEFWDTVLSKNRP